MTDEIFAFLRAILQNPDDEVRRLVFADWLVESGDPDKEIWAKYIRIKWEQRNQSASNDLSILEELSQVQEQFRYRLHLKADEFAIHLPVLDELLPTEQITLRIHSFHFRPVLDLFDSDYYIGVFSEQIARERVLLPVHVTENDLWVVTSYSLSPIDFQTVQFIFNRNLHGVRADHEQIRGAINRIWQHERMELID